MWDIRICFCGGSACAIRNQHLKVRKGTCQHGGNGDGIPDHHELVCAGVHRPFRTERSRSNLWQWCIHNPLRIMQMWNPVLTTYYMFAPLSICRFFQVFQKMLRVLDTYAIKVKILANSSHLNLHIIPPHENNSCLVDGISCLRTSSAMIVFCIMLIALIT